MMKNRHLLKNIQDTRNIVHRAMEVKERLSKWDYIKLKSFCIAKENIKMEREPTVWESIFANVTLDKGLISKIYKEVI